MSNPIRVLLVDDEERFVQNLAKLLRGRGFEVATAFDGAAGVAAVEKSEGFDVVLLDVKMPGMDGIETLRKIKEISPETEVVMLTGHANVETGIAAMREGALDYLMKPCDIEDLVAKITEAHEIEDIRRHPVLWPRHVVKEITWPSFIRLEIEDPLEKALGVFMREPGMSVRDELYILDAENRFQGVVARRDLLEAARRHQTRALHRMGRFDRPPGVAPGRPPAQHHAAGSSGGDGPGSQPGRGRPPHAGHQRALHAGHRRRPGHRHRPAERRAATSVALRRSFSSF